MSIEKQIDEMARIIGHCESALHPDIECHNKATGCYCIENPCHNQMIAEELYNAGYRKQSEGEWVSNRQTDEYICSLCNGIAPVDCEKERFYKSNFCPNCGAKMKGGAE